MLSNNEKSILIYIARNTVQSELDGISFELKEPEENALKRKSGVFVTLHKNGNLRGCIGYISGVKPIYMAVHDMAKEAAFHDPRFVPVNRGEMKDIEFEISVMTPLERIENTDEVETGKHGIFMRRGLNSGLLLPQVAVEYGYDRDSFLMQTCLKAGMEPMCFQDNATEIYIFSADIFSEGEINE